MIEGFPRTGNTFAVTAFLAAQSRHVTVGHHVHAPAQVITAVERRIPTIVLIREPEETTLSLVVRLPHLSLRQALRSYIGFYQPLIGLSHGFVVGTFPRVVTDFGEVTGALNRRFGTAFAEFEHVEQNVRRCFDAIEEADRKSFGHGPALERSRASPASPRGRLKDMLRPDYRAPELEALRSRADEIYSAYEAMG